MSAALQQPSREDFAALLEESFRTNEISEGSVVKGKVVAIEKDVAVIDIGAKTEGRVALKEFAGPNRDQTVSRRRRGRGLCRAHRECAGRGRHLPRQGPPRRVAG